MATLGATAGVLFGDSSSMSVAAANDAFPITTNVWVRVPISRATRFISVVALTGTTGTLYYYFPGQTDA